jgi:hypothetical protein
LIIWEITARSGARGRGGDWPSLADPISVLSRPVMTRGARPWRTAAVVLAAAAPHDNRVDHRQEERLLGLTRTTWPPEWPQSLFEVFDLFHQTGGPYKI